MNIFLTRHGQTVWNTEGRLQGWGDSPLTQKGIEDAKLLGKKLANLDIDIIFSSPSKRAVDTSRLIIGERDIEIITLDELMEINLGNWQGKTVDELQKEYEVEYYNFWNAPHLYVPTNGGESFQDVQKRSIVVIEKIIQEKAYNNVLIVSHAVTLKNIINYYTIKNMDKLWEQPLLEGTSLSLIEVKEGKAHVPFQGDISHI